MAARPPYGQNPFSNQPQYARQYSDSDADSYTSRNASSVPLATSGYYDGTYTPQCEFLSAVNITLVSCGVAMLGHAAAQDCSISYDGQAHPATRQRSSARRSI